MQRTVPQFVDASGTVLFDLNDRTGANNPGGARTYLRPGTTIGSITKERTFFESEHVDGGRLVHKRRVLVMSQFNVAIETDSAAELDAAVACLQGILDRPGILKWQRKGSDRAILFDFEDGEIPTLIRGQAHIHSITKDNFDLDLPVIIFRQPLGRLAEVDSDTNRLVNPTLLRDANADGRPDSWTWASAADISAESIRPSDESYQFTITSTGPVVARELRQVVSPAATGEVWSLAADAWRKGESANASWQFRIQFLDAADVVLQTTGGAVFTTTGKFVREAITAAAPAGTAKVRAVLRVGVLSVGNDTFRVRRAKLEKAATPSLFTTSSKAVSMDPASGGRWFEVFNPGDAPAPVSFRLKGDTGAKIQAAVLALRSSETEGGKSLSRLLNAPVLQCEAATITGGTGPDGSLDGTITPDANASGGNAVKQSIGTGSSFGRLYRWSIADAAVLEGLRGPLNVRLRHRLAGKKRLELQLRWADSLAEPAPVSAPIATHNTNLNGLATFGYVETDLGQIHLPESGPLSGLALEVYARDADGLAAQDHFGDVLMLTPVDQRTSISLPYTARTSRPGSFSSSTLGANRWRAVFKVSILNPANLLARFRVRRTGVDHVIREITYTQDHINTTVELEFDSHAGLTYGADVFTVSGTGTVTVHEVIVERVTVIGENEQLVSDPSIGVDEVKILTATGQDAGHAFPAGPVPFYAPSGLSLVWVAVEEPRIGGQYSELASNLARSPRLAYSVSPRVRP